MFQETISVSAALQKSLDRAMFLHILYEEFLYVALENLSLWWTFKILQNERYKNIIPSRFFFSTAVKSMGGLGGHSAKKVHVD